MLSSFRSRIRAEGWVALIGILACAVVFSGRLQSADEIAIYALAYNLDRRGALDINILASTAPGMRAPSSPASASSARTRTSTPAEASCRRCWRCRRSG